MSNHIEITILTAEQSLQELLIAQLSEIGYEGFEEKEDSLIAIIGEPDFDEINLQILLNKYGLKYSKSIINKQNWNAVWESNFEPVQVDDFVGIRASFHPSFTNVAHEIVITPKMSFGTGHHATTYSVMQLMRELDFTGKSVLDFGTGTGILAILAEKLGAKDVLGLDNDDWCIENASENILINDCKCIDIQKVSNLESIVKYDIILANINKNIILDNVQGMRDGLHNGAQLILSGLLIADEEEILDACLLLGLQHKKTVERNGWIAIWLIAKS